MRIETAIRAWVVPIKKQRPAWKGSAGAAWRTRSVAERALVFDTETTTDFTQRFLFGAFRVYEHDSLELEGLIIANDLSSQQLRIVNDYAARHNLRVYTQTFFVEHIFYPEVYKIGTLCIGFNLPFDLTRIAMRAGPGRGKHRRKFLLQLSMRINLPRIRIEAISGRAAFIEFAPKKKLDDWEKPFFRGRFLDLATLVTAFTGERHTLLSAGRRFGAVPVKSKAPNLGAVTAAAIAYCRNDVHATFGLYERLKEEYAIHPFASFQNERERPKYSRSITNIYSSATIAKQYLKMIGL